MTGTGEKFNAEFDEGGFGDISPALVGRTASARETPLDEPVGHRGADDCRREWPGNRSCRIAGDV